MKVLLTVVLMLVKNSLQIRPILAIEIMSLPSGRKLGGQISKSKSPEMPFLGDIRKRNTSFILTSYRNMKEIIISRF